MKNSIPNLTFRLEPGYTFDQSLAAPEFSSNNILVGGLSSGSDLETFFFGKIAEYQMMKKNVWLDCEGAHAVYVMGKRRSGKTYTLGVIVEGLASNNWIKQGDKKQAVVLLDTMNVFITMPHNTEETYDKQNKQVQEIEKWGLKTETFNVVLFYPKGTQPPSEGNSREIAIKPSELTAEDWASLFEVDTYSDPIGQLISEIYEKVAIEGYIDNNGTSLSPCSGYSIDDFLRCINNCPEMSKYELRTMEAVRRRLNAVKRLPVFSATGTDIKEIFTAGQVSVLLLRDIDQNLRSLLVGILVKKIMQLRSTSDRYERLTSVQLSIYNSFKETNERKANEAYEKYTQYTNEINKGLPRGWIIIDEAHNYMPAKGIVPSSEPLKKYVNEGRNLGLSIVVATQNPSALDPAIRRNADVLIIHSISMRDDIATAEGMVNTWVPDSFTFGREKILSRVFEQLVRSLPLGYAIVSNDRMNRVFVAKIRPRLTVHGGIEY